VSAIRKLLLGSALYWERFAARTRLRRLPAVPAVVAVLVLGLLLPLMASGKSRPASLQPSLAQQRIEAMLARSGETLPEGAIVEPRPTLRWPAMKRTASYEVTLNGLHVVTEPRFEVTKPLAPGLHRFQARGLDAKGAVTGSREGSFEVVEALPRGEILARRPAFYWLPVESAAQYRAELRTGGNVVMESFTTRPRAMVSPPATLEPGRYELLVEGLDSAGRSVGKRRTAFRVSERGENELRDLREAMSIAFEPEDEAFVLAGYYAAHGSPDDVAAALEAFLRKNPKGKGRDLALRALRQRGLR